MGALTFPPAVPALVLFGRDHAGKLHAPWFDAASVDLAAKAAGLMSMRAVPVESDELRELVTSLPRGRLFFSRRAFTPFVKSKLYERLVELTRDVLGLEPAPAANSNEPGAEADGAAPEATGAVEADGEPQANAEPTADTAAPPIARATPIPAQASASTAAAASGAKPAATKPNPRPSRMEGREAYLFITRSFSFALGQG